jgi:transposase-like protein
MDLDKLATMMRLLEEGRTRKEVGEQFGITEHGVGYWIRRLREDEIKVKVLKGPRPLQLKKLK